MRGFCIAFIESFKRWSAFASHTQNKQHETIIVDLSAPIYLASIRLLNVAWAFFNWYYNCSYIFSSTIFQYPLFQANETSFSFTWSVLPDFSLPFFFLFHSDLQRFQYVTWVSFSWGLDHIWAWKTEERCINVATGGWKFLWRAWKASEYNSLDLNSA